MEKLKVTEQPDGTVRFEGGTFEERMDATMEWLARPGGAMEALTALIQSGEPLPTTPPAMICGQAAVHAYLEGLGK